MVYTFTKRPDGLVETYQDGQRISTGAPEGALMYGYGQPTSTESSSEAQTRVSNQGKPGYDVFGNPVPTITSDSGTARADEKALADSLRSSTLRGPLDTSYIDSFISGLAQRRKETEDSINASFNSTRQSLESQQNNEAGSASAGIARAGGYLGFSGSGQGVMLNLAETHKSEMQSLEAKRQAALNEARNAYDDKEFSAAKAKVEEAKAYEQESYDRQQKYFNTLKAETDKKLAADQESAANIDIYNAIAGGAKTETEIFGKLNGKVSPTAISAFFTKLKPKTSATAIYKFTNDDVGKLLHAGLTPQEMQAFTDDLNTHGYASAVAGLSGSQRAVVDELLNGKKTGGVTNGLTISEAKSLGLPPELIGMDEKVFIQSLNSPTPPPWFVAHTEQTYQQNLLPEKTIELWKTFKNTVEQKFRGASSFDFNSISSDVTSGVGGFEDVPSTTPQPTENTDGEENP